MPFRLDVWTGRFCLILVLLTLHSPDPGHSLIPIPCHQNATFSKVCCPRSQINGMVCGGPYRGKCVELDILQEHHHIPQVFSRDDRVNWPQRFFTWFCQCHGNYFGVACDECVYGWTGPLCDQPFLKIRRNIKSLSPKEREILVAVIDKSFYEPSDQMIFIEQFNHESDPIRHPIKWMRPSVQYQMVFDHRYGSRATLFTDKEQCDTYGFLDFNHDSIGFFTWHRYFHMAWDRALEKIARKYFGVEQFALPYWDWTDLRGCDVCTNDLLGAESGRNSSSGMRIHPASPFSRWTEFCVEPDVELDCYACHVAGPVKQYVTRSWNSRDFPTSYDVQWILNKKQFFIYGERNSSVSCSFHRAAEGRCGPYEDDGRQFCHNKIHNMIDGSMCCSGTSPSDPLFIVHHINVDRLFDAWMKKYKATQESYPDGQTRPGHTKMSNLVAMLPIMKHYQLFTHVENLGYTYDSYQFGQANSPGFEQHFYHWERAHPPLWIDSEKIYNSFKKK